MQHFVKHLLRYAGDKLLKFVYVFVSWSIFKLAIEINPGKHGVSELFNAFYILRANATT